MTVVRRTPETILIERQEQAARPRPPQPVRAWPASALYDPTFIRTPPRDRVPMRVAGAFAAKPRLPRRIDPALTWPDVHKSASGARKGGFPLPTLTARSIKIVVVLDSTEVLGVLQQATAIADARVPFTIEVEGRRLRCTFAAKAVRKALATLKQNEPENVVCIVQGKLLRNDEISEAGLVAQVKQPKPEPVVAAAETAACQT
jgi:hypothetical protein